MKNTFTHIIIVVLAFCCCNSMTLNAQNICIGGGNITIELVCLEMLAGGEFGDEEITILTTPVGLGGNALALTDCTEIDDDLGSGGTSSSLGPGLNTIVIPIPYTPGGNFGDNIDFLSNFLINYEIWEDDGGGRCSFDGGDDDYCPNSISVDLASLFGPGGSCLSALNSDGSVDACTVVQDNVIRSNCNGDWVLTYQVTVDLTPPIELSCPGFMSPNSAPVTVNAFETGTTDLLSGGTWSIASGGGIITDNADGSASFDPTGTTPGTSVQLVYTGDNCCQTITTSCFVSIIECPQITAATVASDNCVGEDITLTATISPATAVINQDYILVWQENGTDIAASSSAGADGVPGTADDIISSTYMHTLLAGTATGCAVDDRVFTAELYCLTDFILDAGDPTMTGTDPANTVIEYNAVGQTCIDLDLSTVPTCALASNFSFTTTASSGPPFGNSWISELELEVFQPTGSIGVFTDPLAPNSAGTSTFSGGTNFGGLSSTTPATGIWQMCYEDNFNDNGGATEGVVNHANLTVSSLFPPGCSINSSTTSSVDAVNASTTPLASAPVNAADEVTGLRVCNDPTITTDFTVPTGCTDFAITDVCGSLSIGYASSAAGPFDHALTDASSLVTPADGEQIFYEIYFDADGDGISDCPACATTTGSWTLTACPPPCSITLVNPINIICVDPGTPGDPSDDYIEFSLIVEGASAAGGFSFTSTDDNVTGGCTLTYGTTHSTFRGSPGSAGGGDITLNIVDCGDLSCTAIGTVTDPGACSIPPPPVNNVCDCSNADTPYQINVVATAGPTGYTLIYVLVDNDNGNTVLANNQTGMFAAVADNTNYTVYAFNVLDAELTAFTTALPTTIMTGDDILLEQGAFMDFCYEISEITLNESCNCCPDVTAIPDADLMLGVTESTCTEINGTPMGGVLTAPSPGCPPGSTIQYSLNGGPFQTTLPMHSQASVQTINVRCICDVDDSVISDPVQTVTNPGVCPIPSPLISIDKNDNDDGDDTQTVDVGGTATFSIEICNESTEPLCDLTVAESASIVGVDLSNCEMSGADLIVLVQGTGNGDDQLDPTECISFTCDVPNIGDDFVNTMSVLGIGCDSGIPVNDSDDSDVVLGCPDLGGVFPPQANVEAESICVAVGGSVQVDGGIIKEPIESCMAGGLSECPPGSHIEYSMNGGAWQIDLPVYVQTMAMEIRTRCVCNTDQAVVSETCTVETVPGTCPDPVANVCDCTDLTNPFTINTVAIGGGADYSLLYVLVDNDNGNSVLQNNTTGMFMSVADNVNYSVYAFNVLTTELGTFTGALPATIASGDAILIMTAPFDTFCYDHTVTSYNEDCGCCPELTDATLVPQANIQSNSICTTIGGGGLDIDGGVIAAPVATCGGGTPATCPEGSTLEYSIDGGTWQTDIPVYVQNTSISIQTRCICETDPTSVIEGCTVVTEPGICMDCPADLATFMPGDAVINFESACTDGNVLGGGLISQPNNACPEGSTIQYLVTNSVGVVQSDWSTTLPTYDQNTSITIQTRCTCDSNGANSLFSPGITTTPGVCPDEPANVCDCTMAPNSLTINKIAVNGGQPDYSIVYSLLEVGTTNHIFSDPMGGVASFPNLAEGVDYQFCAYNVLTSELADFSTALADAAAHEDAADGQFFMADGVTEFCYTVSCEIINEDCGCCIANAGDQSTDDCTSFCEGDPAAIVTVDIEFALDASSLASEGPIPGTEYAVYVTDASGKIISLAGQATISTPVQNLSFPVDISAFAVGDYCIHGVNIDLNDPDLNATTLVDFVDLNISSLGNLLTESDGSLTINDATVCGDVNVDNCTPFTITEEITFEAVAICRDFIDISAEADLTGTNYYIEVTNITGGSGTYTVDVGGQTTPLVGNTYGPFNHTGLGTGVVTITVTDDNSTNPTGCVDCVATAEVIETICAETVCDCDASPDGGSILAQSTGYNAIDHCMVYTITKPDGTIEVNETGFYDALPDGEYTVCAFNVLTADKPLFVAALTDATAVELAAAIDASFAAFCYDGLCYDETVECFPDPTLADVKLECTVLGGNVSLSSLFTATTTPGGIFTLAADSPTGATINGGNTLNFSAPGCYHVEYTVGDCPLTDDAFICVPQQPEPSFSIQDEVCFSAGDDPATHIYTPKLNVTPVGTVTWAIDGSSTASGSVDMDGLVTVTSTGVLMICMTEEISYAACGTNAAGSCEATFCQQITITDGTAQDASFTISAQDQCPGTEIVLTPMVEGGEFSGDGVIDNGLGTGATVNIPADCSSVDVTYTLNDPNGCTSSGTQTVFGDRNDPTINVTNVTDLILECNDPNNNNEMLIADWLAANGGATADDACTMTWEYDLVAETDNCSNTGTGTYRFTVTDQCGNFASVEADIIINDNEDPVVVPPTPLVLTCAELSETVDPSLLIKDFCEGAAATDDCDTEVLITHDFTGTLLDLCTAGTVTINFTATDNCGNTHTLPSTITVTPDALAPVFVTEPADLTLDCGDISETTAVTIEGWLNSVTISDACDTDPVLTHDYTQETLDICTAAGSPITVTWTATDACGNMDTRSAILTITPDTAPPVFDTEPANLTLDCGDINETTAVTIEGWLNSVTISDACDTDPVLTHNYTEESLDLCDVAIINNRSSFTVIWTATDACGNMDTRSAVLTITPDTAPPTFDTEPADITLDCGDINETTAITIEGWLNSVTISDICDTDPVLTHDYTQESLDLCTAAGSPITVTWTATDACGNTDTRSAVLTITPDIAPPVFDTEPADLTLDCGDINETTAVTIEGWLNSVTISDVCDTDPVLTHDYTQETLDLCTAAGSPITVTWTATDACGNMDTRTAVLTITPDIAPPVFNTEPADLTLDCGDINETTVVTIEGWLNSVTISDACDTDPVLTHNYTEESLDLCGVPIVNTRSSFTVIWTATDACGNTDTRSAVLTITPDTAPPVFDTEPANLTLDCGDINETTAVTIEGWLNSVTISDACDTDPVLTHDFTTETLDVCTAAGSPFTITWTATDACGNTDTRSAVLTITPDIAPPVFDTEPADLTLDCGDINETTAVTIEGWLNSVTISDACDTDPVLTHDFTTETLDVCTAAGSPFTITWTATDACGNTDTRSAVLTITPDTAPPVFDVEPSDLTLDCGQINETTAITIEGWLNEVQVTDLCDTDPVLTHNFNTQTLDLCTAAGSPITVTWTATDACGNTDSRSAILTITPDVAPPMFDVEPLDIVLDCGDINETTAVTIEGWLNAVEISDICDTDPVLTHDYTTEVLDLCTAAGSPITVTWTATDACGNTDTRSATLTITPDTAPPTFDVEPADLTLSCAEINENVAVTIEGWLNDVQISDACDTDPVLVHDFTTQNLNVCTAAGSPITVTWTASDACGNVDTRTAVLTIIPDVTPPVLSCTGLTTSGDTPFYDCEGDISWDHPLATDDCHVAIYTYTITDPDGTVNGPFDLTGAIASGNLATSFDFEEGVSIVTYYAEDDCGNPSTCSFDVSVGDSVNPFFLDCPADLFVGNDPDECSAKVNWEVPVAWDNCDIPANPDQIELDTSLVVTQLIGFHGANSYDDIQSGQVIPVGNYLIGYLVVDTDGNTDTCSFNLTVWDTQDPILMAGIPEDVTLSCEIQLDTFVMQPHHVMDNCVEDPTIENTLVSTRVMDPEVCEYYSYQDTFFYTVTDSVQILPDGSPKVNQMIWKWVVTWIDTTAPQIIPPPDTLIETCTFDVEIIKSVVQVDSIQVDSLVAVGDDWVIVTVQLKKDSIVCDTIFTPIPISDRMNGLPIVDDNCAPDSLFVLEKPFLTFRDSIEFLCKGDKSAIVHRWWIAEDPCGNIDSAKQLITILADPNPPVLDVYAQDTISLGPDGHVILTRDDLVKSVFNACFADETLITVEISPNYFNCSDIGVHSVLVSATDPCSSQTAYEYVEVTIIDDIAPVLNCPVGSAPIPLTINPRNCDGAFNDILDILDGNDCDVTITTDPPLDASIDMNTTEISVTATDASGNSTTCVVSVSISLTEPIDFDAVLSCNDRVNISLNNECWLELTPDQILEGSPDVCTALLCIEVEDNTGADHLNFFDVTDVGQVFRIRVVDCNGSGNSCWGEVLLEEKQIPEIVWPQDTSVLCVEPTDTSYFKILIPEILNCEPVISIEYEDSYVEYDQCSTPRATITRKWTVTDDEGNVAVDTQLIDIMPFSNNHVRFPKDITIEDPIDCKLVTESIDDIENNILDPTSLLHPDSTGLPNIFGLPLQTNAGLCLFSLGYEDRVLEICSGSYQIFRKWEVNDVCSPYVEGVNPVSHTQVITIYDNDGPVLEEAEIPANDTLSYNPWECAYSGPLKVPGGDIESCGDIFFEAYVTGGGYIVTDGTYGGGDLQIAAVGMGPGDHWITYVYTDGCNNISLYKYVVTVIDEVAPVAVCQGDISITVTTDGVAKIYAKDIDGGSHDAGCGPVSTCIVRMVDFEAGYLGSISGYDAYVAANGCHIDGEFRDTIFDKLGEVESISTVPYVLCKDELKVCCSDLGDQTIVLKATDPTGLSSICMSPISIVDKSNASLVCLPHAIDCTDDKDVDILPPTGSSSICGDELPLKYIDEDEFIDGCGEGQIFRVWYLDANDNGSLDDNEISCNQVITVTNSTSFDPYSLKWPKHYTGEIVSGKNLECNEDDELIELTEDIEMGAVFTCAATDPGDKPVWCNTSCGLVGLSSEIDTVTAGDACLKIIKRWTVVDWCYWEANGASPGDDANDTDNDSFEAVEDWAQGVCSGCTENLADPIYFRYIEVDIDGYYTYDQVIKVVDDTDPVVTTADVIVNTSGGAVAKGDDTPCSGTGIVTASASDLCGSDAITGELISWVIIYNNGTDVTVSNAEGSDVSIETEAGQPGDVHTVTFEVKDGCGNRDAVISTITFGDEKKPVPLCIAGVTTAFMESTGTVDVWAKDFDLGSFDNCTDVDFTVVFRGESPDSSQANITFDCDDITKLYDLDIWVWDENGNGDFCTTSVIIGGTCEGDEGASSALISGQISTALGDMIEEAEVTIGSSGISEYPLSQMTTSSGEYAFLNNPTGFDFDITVLKDGDYLNGVTTADLIAIQEHISGEALLDSPYKVIAADINNDQQVSILDVIVLRNVILGISRRFTNNTSWRFVDESQSFADMFSPWPFIEVLDIPSLATDQLSEDFIGVKIGDVTDDVAANSFALASSRTDEYLDFEITEAFIEESNTVLVPVSSDRFENIVGFQFTLEHKGLEFEGIESGAIDISSEHIGQHEDALTVSWDNLDPITSDETLFSFRFTASSDVELSDALTLNSKITKAEIYRGTEIDMANLGLQISTQDIGLAKLHQNDPNPFVSQTTIGFELPVASEAILLIYTIDGKELKRIEGNFAKGLNEVIVTESDIDFSGGLLYYQLQVGEFTDTKKMMVVK